MFVLVAVPVPALDLLTYRVPDDMAPPPVGGRVVVPLGSRSVTGLVVSRDVSPVASGFSRPSKGLGHTDVRLTPDATKAITRVLDLEPLIPADVIELARWTAEYYAAGVSDTILSVLPPKTRGDVADAHKTERHVSISAAGHDALDTGTAKQREALALLAASPDGLSMSGLAARGLSTAVVSRLAERGLVVVRRARVERDPAGAAVLSTAESEPRALTEEQSEALARLTRLGATRRFHTALLHGVTGSGKTEIYLRLAATTCQAGRRVLMLVPEIALTPALATVCRQAFGDRVAIQHSGLGDGERHDQWQRIRRGEIDVVVGTRSAIFAPLAELGLVIVDEEHDPSYKQEETPRYNGRDVAIVRGQRASALVVLGSATPSMETYANALAGKYEHVVMARRVLDRPLAAVTVVNMREEYAAEGPDVVLSRALREALADRQSRGEQSLVLLNRRGFATAVFCRQCAGTIECPNCSVSLVVHGEGTSRRARCHYCNYNARVPSTCPQCKAPYLEQAGFGTQRVEAEVAHACPSVRVARLDRDSIRRKGTLIDLLTRFRRGEIDVLVGTQMIAKGHDFPKVTLVGVISADVGLGMADFRAGERTFQLLTQVAGRAGRGDRPGEAIVQTIYPDHYSIQLACRQDYKAFYDKESHFRRAMRYPPQVALVNAVVRGRTFDGTMDDATEIVNALRAATARQEIRVLGPAPAPLGKLRGEFRVQWLMKGQNRRAMREALTSVLSSRPDIARRTIVDIDPVSVT